ncbi:MAG: hypothetical protein ACOY33_08850 [Pseudomonadota bacterium]
MPRRLPVFTALLLTGLTAAWCLPAVATDDMTPRPQRIFTEKPRIEDYSDYSAFLVDIMEYRRQREERAAEAARNAAAAPAAPTADPVPEDPALYAIRGPESLDDALARASRLPHPVYSEPERFGRTTALSFPIPPMEGEDMSANEVAGRLSDLESLAVDVYEEEGAQRDAAGSQTRNPTNDAKARQNKADEGTNDAYRVSYDSTARIMTDSDGRRLEVPLVVENEVGFTVIKHLDIVVESISN